MRQFPVEQLEEAQRVFFPTEMRLLSFDWSFPRGCLARRGRKKSIVAWSGSVRDEFSRLGLRFYPKIFCLGLAASQGRFEQGPLRVRGTNHWMSVRTCAAREKFCGKSYTMPAFSQDWLCFGQGTCLATKIEAP